MNATFRQTLALRNCAVLGIVFGVVIAVCFAQLLLQFWNLPFNPAELPQDVREDFVAQQVEFRTVLITTVCANFFLTTSPFVWMLIAYHRRQLTIEKGRIFQRGVIRSRELDFDDVKEVQWGNSWRPAARGVVLKAISKTIKVRLHEFSSDEGLSLIRYFRAIFPDSIQKDWEPFCRTVALPLHDRVNPRPPGPDEIRITRRRLDLWFLLTTVGIAVVALMFAIIFGERFFWVLPIITTLAGIVAHFSVPPTGFLSKRPRVVATKMTGILVFWGIWFSVAAGGILWFVTDPSQPKQNVMLFQIGAWSWYAVLLASLYPAHRRITRQAHRTSEQEWDKVEAAIKSP